MCFARERQVIASLFSGYQAHCRWCGRASSQERSCSRLTSRPCDSSLSSGRRSEGRRSSRRFRISRWRRSTWCSAFASWWSSRCREGWTPKLIEWRRKWQMDIKWCLNFYYSLYIKPHSVLGVPTKVAFLVFFFVLCEFGFSNNGGF